MTNYDPVRLDRIEALTESNAQAISELRIGLTDIRTGLADVRLSAESLIQVVTIHQANIEAMQSEIRGLQLENRRLFQRFFPDETSE